MSTLTELRDVVTQTTVEYDWKKYERYGKEFLRNAKRIGSWYGDKVLEHQEKINGVAKKLREKKISASSAKRVIARHKSSMKNYLQAAGEAMKWEVANRYWDATEDLLNFLMLLASKVIVAL